ncbi:hypothetical protein, partial [Stenotrophomonas maltophilia]|uniref:hypothetical protein n=1 Tax=Stenotrophomonas maltophilia TaxID=40324 RepID=UPI0034E1F888
GDHIGNHKGFGFRLLGVAGGWLLRLDLGYRFAQLVYLGVVVGGVGGLFLGGRRLVGGVLVGGGLVGGGHGGVLAAPR